MDIAEWLRGLGLGRYEQAFRENGIDAEVLPHLTSGDLKDLGVDAVGHRRKLLNAIARLSGADPDDHPPPPRQSPAQHTDSGLAAERRRLTVMFVDLVGSTALASKLDPEDMGVLLHAYRNAVSEALARFGGEVGRFIGDGALAYFGWPRAREDDAERAVRAALAAVASVTGLRAPDGQPLAARAGIATGLAVVGALIDGGRGAEDDVVGETPNLAARLQAEAEVGTVVIAESTRRLLGGLFTLEDLGPLSLKGITRPVRAFRVRGDAAVADRFGARRAGPPPPLVGRERELGALLRHWRVAKAGSGRSVVLVGDAGIGKSRLVRALREALRVGPHGVLRYQCSPHHSDTALWPVVGQISRAAGFTEDDSDDRRLAKLKALLNRSSDDLGEAISLLADLLGINGDRCLSPDLTLQERRARTLRCLVDQIEGLATHEPLLVIFEDVHWADPTTLELIEQAAVKVASVRVLMILTTRHEGGGLQFDERPYLKHLALDRLDRVSIEAIILRLAEGRNLPAPVVAEIVARSDGVPLFAEELTAAVLDLQRPDETANGRESEVVSPALAVPATLHDSLMERLDRTPTAKLIAQVAACIGREFEHALLAAVTPLPEAEVRAALARLSEAGIVSRRGAPPKAKYSFKHALVRDAAYGSLLRAEARRIHNRLVELLDGKFAGSAEAVPGRMAQHCEAAGLLRRAAEYRLRAGREAIEKSAAREAVAHLRTGLRLLARLREPAIRDGLELELSMALGTALIVASGYAAPETGAAFDRALDLCERLDRRDHLPKALYGLTLYHMDNGRHRAALQVAQRLLDAERADSEVPVLAHRLIGTCQLYLGNFGETRRHCEAGLRLYDPAHHDHMRFTYAQDQKISLQVRLSRALLALGYPLQALRHARAALSRSRGLDHPHTRAFAIHTLTYVFRDLRAERLLRLLGGTLLDLAECHDFRAHRAGGLFALGAAALLREDHVAACELLGRSLEAYREAHARYLIPLVIGDLAAAEGLLGRGQKAQALLDEALRMVERNEEHCLEAPLRQIAGRLMRDQDAGAAIEQLRCALEVARGQGARWFELRAARDLAHLWAEQGERQSAHDLLAPIYRGFAEGLGAPDLKEAEALLTKLAGAGRQAQYPEGRA